jgi:hypothetical protein
MGHRNGAYVVETLHDHLESGETCTLYCAKNHSKTIGFDKLIEIFGADFIISKNRNAFLRRFKCQKCGGRAVQVIIGTSKTPRW